MNEAVLGTGTLTPVRQGEMHGQVTFDVRGTFGASLNILTRHEDGYWLAKFTCGSASCQVHQVRPIPDGEDETEFWHGYITADSYEFRAKIYPGTPNWRVEMLDTIQRRPARPVFRVEEEEEAA